MFNPQRKYDLEERNAKFGEKIIGFYRSLPQNSINRSLINQIVRSGTSIGANYAEANQTVTVKDFINKMVTCKKESNETKYWLRMIAHANPERKQDCRNLWKEAHEYILIFSKSVSTAHKNLLNIKH